MAIKDLGRRFKSFAVKTDRVPGLSVSLNIFRLCYFYLKFLLYKDHFIRNLHVDGRNILGTYTTNGKKAKGLLNF